MTVLLNCVSVFLISFLVTILVTPWLIRILHRFKIGQIIQEDGPQTHRSKAGTPSMGGIAILVGMLFAGLIALQITDPTIQNYYPGGASVIAAVFNLVGLYAIIGFADDWLTIHPRNSKRGIDSKSKFLLQLIVASAFVYWLYATGNLNPVVSFGTWLNLDLGWFYAPLAILFITGMANFINITDGLDGLASGLTVILALTLAAAPAILTLDPAGGIEQVISSVFLSGLAGACAAFLWFNFNPAKVFMGDTGSLAIGAAIPALAIAMKLEILMIIAGMVFIIDGLSSAFQWAVFKYTRITTGTGRRIFSMSPIHHHFELSGWPEQLVVVRFWIVGAICALIAILLSIFSVMK